MKAILPVIILLGLTAGLTRMSGEACLSRGAPEWFGSRRTVLEQIPENPGTDYGFAVLGDIQQGIESFQVALGRISGDPGPDFAVVCGDLVNNETEPHYRLLFDAARSAGSRVPVVTVPGNHDDPGNYRRLVGPPAWTRRVGRDLLVGVDNGWRAPTDEELSELARSLGQPGLRHRFVFLHRPLIRDGAVAPHFRPLLDTLERGRVDVVFAGHAHSYDRIERNGVLHISNGLGGDLSHDTDGDAWLTLVQVGPDGITDRPVHLGRSAEIVSRVRDAFVAHLYATLAAKKLWSPLLALLLTIAMLTAWRRWGEAAGLPLVAVFLPGFASPPHGAVFVAGCFGLIGAAVIRTLPRRPAGSARWTALCALLLLARSPWLAAAALLPTLASRLRRTATGGRVAAGVTLRGLLTSMLVVAIWAGPGATIQGPAYAIVLIGSASGWAIAGEMRQSPE